MTNHKDKILLLDGATGTELDKRGVDISLPLWSAGALIHAPETLLRVHCDYLNAGAYAITANTFRTNQRALSKAGLDENAAKQLTLQAVQIAQAARDKCNANALVLGSVAPLEDCYRPDLSPDEKTCEAEHGQMIANLLEAEVDLLLIETMNNLTEAKAAISQARKQCNSPAKWIVSFCMKSQGSPGELLSGENVIELFDEFEDAFAVGVNCTAAPETDMHMNYLRKHLPKHIKIAAYANIGSADQQGNWISTDAIEPQRYAEYAMNWIDSGATIIGGCCGTTPTTIAAIANRLDAACQAT
ncbi:MAG: homocysteine S-methyltransferase family protein [Planctomycetes bacterium]|nr:homocysteine S-methyltransferase family protein [Planctomycetota bacterium]